MERKVRKLKRFAAGTLDPDTAKAYRKKVRQAQQELKAFINANSEVLRRDYSREKVYGVGLSIILDTIIKKFDRRKPFEGTHRTVVCST